MRLKVPNTPNNNNNDYDESIIQDMIRDENEQGKKTVVISPDIPLLRKRQARDLGVKVAKVALAISIIIFMISLFSPWFQLKGSTTELGFVHIKESMIDETYRSLDANEQLSYEGTVVLASPMQLATYVFQYFEDHKISYGSNGESVSVISWIHRIVILTFLLVLFLSMLSVLLLIISPGLKHIRIVKISSIMSLLFCCLNFFVLKIPYLNMFVIHAQSMLKQKDLINAVSITGKGIAVNRQFYPYSMDITHTFLIGFGVIGIWIIISAVLLEIKRKREEDLHDIELKAKTKV